MNQLRILFFLALLVVVAVIMRRNSSHDTTAKSPAKPAMTPQVVASASPTAKQVAAATATPSATASPTAVAIDFKKVVERVTPAVAQISTFDATGKLLRSGSGIFVSQDGRLLTSSDLVQNAAHAVAKVADG